MSRKLFGIAVAVVLSSFFTGQIQASQFTSDEICYDKDHQPLPVMNDVVIEWKKTTPNQFLGRALIRGHVVQVPAPGSDRDHLHFVVDLDHDLSTTSDHIEAVFNNDFGDLHTFIKVGLNVLICGDYITSNKNTGRYKASPQGAIIHWLHYNPGDRNGGKHKDGFVIIDGNIVGSNPNRRI